MCRLLYPYRTQAWIVKTASIRPNTELIENAMQELKHTL